MLFQAVVIFLPILNFLKISCKRGKVHYWRTVVYNKPAYKLEQICSQAVTSCVRAVCPKLSEQVWNKLLTACKKLDGIIRLVTQGCNKATGMRVLPVRKVCKMGSQ